MKKGKLFFFPHSTLLFNLVFLLLIDKMQIVCKYFTAKFKVQRHNTFSHRKCLAAKFLDLPSFQNIPQNYQTISWKKILLRIYCCVMCRLAFIYLHLIFISIGSESCWQPFLLLKFCMFFIKSNRRASLCFIVVEKISKLKLIWNKV